jgi:putative transposase
MKTNRLRLYPTPEQADTLREMGQRVSALWNVANYACRQALFARQKVPTYFTLYDTFRAHPAFRALPNDMAHETLKKLSEAWKSWRQLVRLWKAGTVADKPGLPRYRKHSDGTRLANYLPIKCERSYRVTGKTVAMTLPTDLRQGRLSIAYRGTVRYTGRGRRAEIRSTSRRHWEMTYSVQGDNNTCRPWTGVAGIDLGIRVLASVSVAGVEEALHFVGREVVKDFEYWTAKIATHQRELAHRQRKTSRRLKRLYATRGTRLRHAICAMARRIVFWCRRHRVGQVVIGWPKGILLETTANAKWQRLRHTLWSFDAVATRLADTLRRAGMSVARVGERGTSSHCPRCDSANVSRRPRHVLRCRDCQFRCHSDQAGSRNLLRQTYPDLSWARAEAAPRPETRRWQYHRWVDVENPATAVAGLRAA